MPRIPRTLGLAGIGLLVAASSACSQGTLPSAAAADQGQQPAAPAAAAAGSSTAGSPAASAQPTTTEPAAPAPTTAKPAASPKATTPAKPAPKKTTPPKAAKPAAGAPLKGSGTWKRAFAANAGAVGCNLSYAQFKASKTPRLTFGSKTVFVGFQQYGNNQDPVFVRFDSTRKVYCEHHEHQAPDSRAVGITWNGGPTAYVAYTTVGGGTEFDAKAKGGWLKSYGDGGASSKVTVLGTVELTYGTVQRATFVTAKLPKNGMKKTNSLVPVGAPQVLSNGRIALYASTTYSPLNPDQSLMCTTGAEYPKSKPGRADKASYLAIFASNLGSEQCAQTWGCMHVRKPCPNVA